jgi:hypothetical protein
MALGCGLTSVRGNRGKNYKKMNRWFPKNIQRKKIVQAGQQLTPLWYYKQSALPRWYFLQPLTPLKKLY